MADDRFKIAKRMDRPKEVNGLPVEGTFRAHQVPLPEAGKNPVHLKQLEDWLKSYKPEELFDEKGKLIQSLADLAPRGKKENGCESACQWRLADE